MAVLLQNLFAQLVKKLPALRNLYELSVHNKAQHSKSKWMNGDIAPLILNLGNRLSFTPCPVQLRGKSLWYSLNWRFNGFRRRL